jgi:hypothetical protein
LPSFGNFPTISEEKKNIFQNQSIEQAPPQQNIVENKKTAAEEERLNQYLINQFRIKIKRRASSLYQQKKKRRRKNKRTLKQLKR